MTAGEKRRSSDIVTSTVRDASDATPPWPNVSDLGPGAPAGAIAAWCFEPPQPARRTRTAAAMLIGPAEQRCEFKAGPPDVFRRRGPYAPDGKRGRCRRGIFP